MSQLFWCIVLLGLTGPALWLLRPHRSHSFAWLAAAVPAAVTAWQAWQFPMVAAGAPLTAAIPWVPTLGLELSLRVDSLALFFGLIVTGIGTCIAFYTNYYFEDDPHQGYFYLLLFLFMMSMLGLVWADNVLTLFVFWEGTSITSYLMIAFKSSYKGAVEGARRALIVTTAGGLAMLAGLIIWAQAAGTYEISALIAKSGFTLDPLFPVVLMLLLLGAFTKSAQFPFHFWLPGAMSAPTPASAYLHSATMVKAGVYLLARFHPALSDSPLWFWSLLIVGGVTMVFGAVTAIRYTDMKAVLAYTTISALGTATALLAFNSEMAAVAVTVTILAHALYKAPLFLTAGTVDHAVGTRDLRFLAGLWRPLPVVAVTGMLAALSMAGVPPTWGFLAKELLLEQFFDVYGADNQWLGAIGYGAAVIMGIFAGGAVFALIWEAFLRSHADEPEPAHVHHKPSFWFALPALILATLGAFTALFIGWLEPLVVAPAQAILGAPLHKHLALWHGWNFILITSLGILAAAVVVAAGRRWVRRAFAHTPPRLSGVYVYDGIVDGIYRFAYQLTRIVQGGPMAPQITVTLMAAVAVLGYAVYKIDLKNLTILDSVEVPLIPEILIFLVAIVAAVATVRSRSRLSAIISLGVVGVAVTLFFIFYSAPDLALTQLLIEVLTVVLLVLVFFRVKPDGPIGRDNRIILRLVVSVLVGFFGFAIVMFNHIYQVAPSISPYFIANSLPLGQGANVVNVILVDIRGYDTMGEITVLTLAALGGYAVIRSPQVNALRQRLAGLSRARKQDAVDKPAGAGDD